MGAVSALVLAKDEFYKKGFIVESVVSDRESTMKLLLKHISMYES